MAFLLQAYFEHLDEKSRGVATQMTDHWIKFTNGEQWAQVGEVVLVEEKGVVAVDEREYEAKYRNGSGQVLEEIGWDRLWTVAEAWQGVRPDESRAGEGQKL